MYLSFKFQPKVCHICHDIMQKTMSFNDLAIVTIKGNDCRIHFLYMSKDEDINILRKACLTEKNGTLQNCTIG